MSHPTHATVSLRISTFLWEDDVRRLELLDLLRSYRGTIDEVAFFTGFTHPPLPLATIEARSELLGRILPDFRAAGVRAGINHLAFMGHHAENLPNSLSEPWQRVVGPEGATCEGSFCSSDPRHREYIRLSAIAMARSGPDFLWIDDDVRMEGHAPVWHACFCDLCLAEFAAETGAEWTREALVAALSSGTREDRLAIRRKWLDRNRRYMARLMRTVREAVDEVAPGLPLGEMTGEMAYSGYGFDLWANTLAGEGGATVKWRPGGGFYTDEPLGGMLEKAHTVGRQIAQLPGFVSDIQYEHENFPYQPIRKSVAAFTAEIATSIGAGCTGVALNCMGITVDPFTEYRHYFDAVASRRAFYDRCVQACGRSACEGLWPAFGRDHIAVLSPDGSWFDAPQWGGDFATFRELAEIGLPSAYGQAGASVTLLSGDTVLEYTREELERLLAGCVAIDGAALARIEEAGLGRLTGFRAARTVERDMVERLTPDPINGRWAGRHRDCRPSFWRETAALLEPTAPGARILTEIIDFTPDLLGNGSGVYENELGGRVAVLGHYAWRSLSGLAASTQTKALYRWLSRDTLPAYVASYHRASLWCRRTASGQPAIVLLNASLDPQAALTLHVRTDAAALVVAHPDGRETQASRVAADGPYGVFEVGPMGAWEAALVTG